MFLPHVHRGGVPDDGAKGMVPGTANEAGRDRLDTVEVPGDQEEYFWGEFRMDHFVMA